jgi:chitin synthase
MHGDGYSVSGVNGTDDGTRYQIANSNENLPWKILVTQIACGYAAYIFGKFACKVNIQKFAFAIPLTLVMPASIATVLGLCEVRSGDPCKFSNDRLPNHLFFQCPMDYTDPEGYDSLPLYVFSDLHGWVWILLFLAQCWIAGHIWVPKSRKLAKTEQMFGTPWYNGLLTDQSMMLNRRSDKGQLDFRLDFQMSKSGNSGGKFLSILILYVKKTVTFNMKI